MASTKQPQHDLESKPAENFIEVLGDDEKGGGPQPGADFSGVVKKTSAEVIALVRKLDMRIMPKLWCVYFLNYLDRNAIAQARLDGLEDDLKLEGSQYNTCISILFVGYLLMQIPSNMLMSSKHVRPSLYMAVCMMAWAGVSACAALDRNYTDLVVVRFFLGVTEAPFYPGAIYMLSIFYTRKEIAMSFSGLIAAAVFNTIDGNQVLNGWQWLFIIEGCLTFGIAIIGIFTLAENPLTTRYIACFLFASGANAVNSMILGWVSATLGSTPKKKAVSLSIVNVVANASYIYTAYLTDHVMASNAAFAFASIAGTWAVTRVVDPDQ
ncbi:hypothetical protein INS49_005778 [Diaporthe citri]|uniref:uncharacterized protein n=1 Tax=Diaporthe citri TaxID=83186 RepID=UPI001C7E51B9|nr:uncharacterized protein INS49_005778 [Diaporthe citri]KAG6364180.1 hypothetical protein INS49_005778 [Diaporthe citri]